MSKLACGILDLALFIAIYTLLILHVSAGPITLCSDLYGSPKSKHCLPRIDRLLHSSVNGGRPSQQKADRVFSMKYHPRPWWATKEQDVLRNLIPQFSRHIKGNTCSVALLAIREGDGFLTADVSAYPKMTLPGLDVIDECVLGKGTGGIVMAGEYRRLVLALYEPNSAFHKQMQEVARSGNEICAKGTTWAAVFADDIDGVTSCDNRQVTANSTMGNDHLGNSTSASSDDAGSLRLPFPINETKSV